MIWWLCRNMLPMHPHIFTRPFSSLPPLSLPSPRETHLWYVVPDEVKDKSLLNQYAELLSPCERNSILQMDKGHVQKRALLARALVRTTLARYTNSGINSNSLKFRKNRFGKPEVDWKNDDPCALPALQFNVSHTSSLIACGVTMEVPIGIDVEEKQRKLRNNILSFARRYFSPSEIEFLHSFSDPDSQRQELLKLWTLKEAYVKALGRGFSAAPFRDFRIRFVESEGSQFPRIVVDVPDTAESLTSNWQFGLFELDGSHYAAICLEKNMIDEGNDLLRLKVWKTLPLVEEVRVEKNALINISGLS